MSSYAAAENISPGEIEDVLRSHPGVADVAVLGLPDDQWGEQVAAFVVARGARPTEAELAAWVQARLRSVKTPQTWSFREALPYNDTGKLLAAGAEGRNELTELCHPPRQILQNNLRHPGMAAKPTYPGPTASPRT